MGQLSSVAADWQMKQRRNPLTNPQKHAFLGGQARPSKVGPLYLVGRFW
jgi:hypothetical protein